MSTQTNSLVRALPSPTISLQGVGDIVARASARARALGKAAAKKADNFANRASTNLSRVTFFSILLLPFVQAADLPPPHPRLATAEVAPGVAAIRTRSVHVEAVPVKPQSGPEHRLLTEIGQTPLERTRHFPEPAKPQTEFPDNPKPSQPVTAEDPAKPAEAMKTVEKDKPAPPPPLPPSEQPAAPWTEEQIAAANKECSLLLDKITVVAQAEPPEREGICGAPAPRTLKSLGQSHVEVVPPQMLNCPMIAGLNSWLTDKLQPAAQKIFGSPIVRMLGASSYSCRNRYGLAKAPISEHAFMNAIDISGFALANGKIIRVSQAWKPPASEKKAIASAEPAPPVKKRKSLALMASKLGAANVAATAPEATKAAPTAAGESKETKDAKAASAFLHEVHDEACGIFGTVLGPDANDAHHDHFHLDMKERKYRSICE